MAFILGNIFKVLLLTVILTIRLSTNYKLQFTRSNYNLIAEEDTQKLQQNVLTGIQLVNTNFTYDDLLMEVVDDSKNLFMVEKRKFGKHFVLAEFSTKSEFYFKFNMEDISVYKFRVRASIIGGMQCFASVTVNVLDRNDLTPQWPSVDELQRIISVPENATLYRKLTRFLAKDYDFLPLHNQVYYAFIENNDRFYIDPITGWVIVGRSLLLDNRVRTEIYNLSVIAINGFKAKHNVQLSRRYSRRMTLTIQVHSVNLYAPEFQVKELPNLMENSNNDIVYAVFDIFDQDNDIKTVKIIDGDSSNYFVISKRGHKEYWLIARKSVDRELFPNGFQLTIEAKDNGDPFRATNYSMRISVQDLNDNSPLFAINNITVEINECDMVWSPVAKLSARDTDLGKNAEIVYSIESGNELGWFSIDSRLGVIRIASQLDYDQKDNRVITLKVNAQDQANKASRKISTASIIINLQDCNDNFPIFTKESLASTNISIPESAVEKLIVRIKATDKDSNDNGKVIYLLKNCNKTLHCPFIIDRNSGEIYTTKDLDFDFNPDVWNITVVARDSGKPFRRISYLDLHLVVTNVNDNAPIMMQIECNITMSKETKLHIFDDCPINAMDVDNNEVRMEILGENENFKINKASGILSYKKIGNRKKQESQHSRHQRNSVEHLQITASDSNNNLATRPTLINVKYIRSRDPPPPTIKCRENAEAIQTIERSNRKKHLIEGTRNRVLSEKIYENRFFPKFINFTPSITINEDLTNHTITTITARDNDIGYNGRIVFLISEGNEDGAFKIQTKDNYGHLYVFGGIDRERKDEYKLRIKVSDRGNTPRAIHRDMIIRIADSNDNKPIIEKKSYRLSIKEDIEPETAILKISATDADIGLNAKLVFYMLTNTKYFRINRTSGEILVNKKLDRENIDFYELLIEVSDQGESVQLKSTTTVYIQITDVNDNRPRCQSASLTTINVREDLLPGSVVTIVQAYDNDLGVAGEIRYSFSRKTLNSNPPFIVNKDTGIITLKEELNYVKNQSYRLTIVLRDRGKPNYLSNRCKFLINVIDCDENRYAPYIKDIAYSFSINENIPRGTFIVRLNAVDDDRDNNVDSRNYELDYSIVDGSGLGLFVIDSTGEIRSNEVFDCEIQDNYWLQVQVTDNGLQPKSDVTFVNIDILDINDNAPTTSQLIYRPSLNENTRPGRPVLQLRATDKDRTPSIIEYEIIEGDPQGFFNIDRHTGHLTTSLHSRTINREMNDRFHLQVQINDNGTPNLSSITLVEIEIIDENDNLPEFYSKETIFLHLTEMNKFNKPFAFYKPIAFDKDVGINAKIMYSLKNVSKSLEDVLYINETNGFLYTKKNLLPGLVTDLYISVRNPMLDSNDHTTHELRIQIDIIECQLKQEFYVRNHARTINIKEDAELFSLVVELDIEGSKTSCMRYYLDDSNEDNNQFFIPDLEMPRVRLAKLLDYEQKIVYNLTIRIANSNSISIVWLQVNVININDEYPIIKEMQSAQQIILSEATAIDDLLFQVEAHDPDNDPLNFYIKLSSTTNSLNKFTIDSRKGHLRLKEPLDHEVQKEHEIVICVSDGLHEVFQRLLITVENYNEHAPKFVIEKYSTVISPLTSFASKILQVHARDSDTGEAGRIRYSIVNGNIGNCWRIDENDGSIYVNTNLESVNRKTFKLIVEASDSKHVDSVSVSIDLSSRQTDLPIFDRDFYVVQVEENRKSNYALITLQPKNNVIVSYEIVKGNIHESFKIDPTTGTLMTDDLLDFETIEIYNLTIRVFNLDLKSVDVFVIVKVTDVNDNKPVWKQAVWYGSIYENSKINAAVINTATNQSLLVSASDKDSGLNGQVEYILSNYKEYFNINSLTGSLTVKQPLDREKYDKFAINVRVKDRAPINELYAWEMAFIYVTVLDIDDCPPKFDNNRYATTLLLPTIKDVHVMQVAATDPDLNSNLKYELLSKDLFYIDENTGDIYVSKAIINPPNNNKNILTAQVTDGINTKDWAEISIVFQMANGSKLQFDNHTVFVEEERERAIELFTIVPSDHNQYELPIHYRLLNYRNLFALTSYSGMLQTRNHIRLDRELKSNYTLLIQAQNLLNDNDLAQVFLRVVIKDINDHQPLFVRQPYIGFIRRQSTNVGDICFNVTAIDNDANENGLVKYSLQYKYKDDKNYFVIDKYNGYIKLNRKLKSFDHNREFEMYVTAKDSASRYMQSKTNLTLTIIDDDAPKFLQSHYIVTVKEDSEIGTVLVNVEATSRANNVLSYSIISGDEYDDFDIDYDIGSVRIKRQLDYDNIKYRKYLLVVQATETLTNHYDRANIKILVEDANDNRPVLNKNSYEIKISENSKINTHLLSVTATDVDSSLNGKLRYVISTQNQYLRIDADNGQITLAKTVDREMIDKIEGTVKVFDYGTPNLSSEEAKFIVWIEDENDNIPVMDKKIYNIKISEKIVGDAFICAIHANDRDKTDITKLLYKIIDGNVDYLFILDAKSGILRTTKAIDKTVFKNNIYSLNITVTDGTYNDYAIVNIKIERRNFYTPKFSQNVYTLNVILDELHKGMSLKLNIRAIDNDRGRFGKIQYIYDNNNEKQDIFAVDKRTAKITLLKSIERIDSNNNQIDFKIIAIDGGKLQSKCLVRLNLISNEQLKPKFRLSEYKANLIASSSRGTHVLQLEIENNLNISVTFQLLAINTTINDIFSIDASGMLSLNIDLDSNHVTKLYQFFAVAININKPMLKSQVPIQIYVRGYNDKVPKFVSGVCNSLLNIPENIKIGTIITRIKTDPIDNFQLSIVTGNVKRTGNEQFDINQKGELKISERLDREDVEFYTLTIRAETFASPSIVNDCIVQIKIADINDNKPIFENLLNEVTVYENQPIGTSVAQVTAIDADAGLNGTVSYNLENYPNQFTIDGKTGFISTVESLNCEERNLYNLIIVATDYGLPSNKAKMELAIKINNLNDMVPTFEKRLFSVKILENSEINFHVYRMQAIDLDIDSSLSYFISDGNAENKFTIDSDTGVITVKNYIDREETPEYNLEIVVTDGLFNTKANLRIGLLDINDNDPICQKNEIVSNLAEDVIIDSIVVERVEASDPDEGRNADISYYLTGENSHHFSVGNKNGQVKTAQLLDYETYPIYNLIITVDDGGGRFCRTILIIKLINVNDNPPKFKHEEYRFSVNEGTKHSVVGRVTAIDPDGIKLDGQRIQYSLLDESDKFDIDIFTGIIILKHELDREEKDQYEFKVYAQETIDSIKVAASVFVTVLDINDNPPVFEKLVYEMQIYENFEIGKYLLTIKATSKDIGLNAVIKYYFIETNPQQNPFNLNDTSGKINIGYELDYEKRKLYDLHIKAIDSSKAPLIATTLLRVKVLDVNDNLPKFSMSIYETNFEEGKPKSSSVITIEAIDADSGDNGRVSYVLHSCKPEYHFRIDEHTGLITTVEEIDREQVAKYQLNVEARDFGRPRLTSTALVNILISDINDNKPVFTEENYYAVIQVNDTGYPSIEHSQIDYSVIQVTATDPDGEGNGEPIRYSMMYGGNEKFRIIPETGLILTTDLFQLNSTFAFKVKAWDQGGLSSLSTVNVRVVEVGRNAPILYAFNASMRISDEKALPGPIGRLRAYDKDPYDSDRLRFGLHSNKDLFRIDPHDGTLWSLTALSCQLYSINVSVSDTKHITFSTAFVNIESLPKLALLNTVVVHINDIKPNDFLHAKFKEKFINVVGNLIAPSGSMKRLLLLGMEETDHVVIGKRRRRSGTTLPTDLLLFLAVEFIKDNAVHIEERYENKLILKNQLNSYKDKIEELAKIKIIDIFIDNCQQADCKSYECITKIDLSNLLNRYITEEKSFVGPKLKMVSFCNCPIGFRGRSCSIDATECLKCRDPGICLEKNGVYKCVCPIGFSCMDTTIYDEDELSFNGNSYIEWKVAKSIEYDMKINLEMRTDSKNGRIMQAIGTRDEYNILEINNGFVRYVWNCGDGRKTLSVEDIEISDGNWHEIELKRDTQCSAKLTIDSKSSNFLKSNGIEPSINLDTESLYFGANLQDGIVKNTFKGCLRHIVLNSQPLHPSVAMFTNVDLGCRIISTNLPCFKTPCKNGGTCQNINSERYRCHCSTHTSGVNCQNLKIAKMSTQFGIRGIIIIVAIILFLILFALILICCVRWQKSKSRRRRELTNGNCTYNKVGDELDPCKYDLEMQPPPIPQRPSSYTPSEVGSTLMHNFTNDIIEGRNNSKVVSMARQIQNECWNKDNNYKNNLNICFDAEKNKDSTSSGAQSSFDVQSEGPTYNWDTSDWAKSRDPLPEINQISGSVVPDSGPPSPKGSILQHKITDDDYATDGGFADGQLDCDESFLDTDDDLDDEFRNMTLDLNVRTDLLNDDHYGFPMKPMAPLTYDDYVSNVSDENNEADPNQHLLSTKQTQV